MHNRVKNRILAVTLAAAMAFTLAVPASGFASEAPGRSAANGKEMQAAEGKEESASRKAEGKIPGEETEETRHAATDQETQEEAAPGEGGKDESASSEKEEPASDAASPAEGAEDGSTAEPGEDGNTAETAGDGNTAEPAGDGDTAEAAEGGSTAEPAEDGDPSAAPVEEPDGSIGEENDETGRPGEEPEETEEKEDASRGGSREDAVKDDIQEKKEKGQKAFDAEKKVGGLTVKIHADKGVFPEGVTVSVTEMKAEVAKAYVEKVEEMADDSYAVAAIDITFRDKKGKEIQPKGSVTIRFEGNTSFEGMSVYHAEGGDASGMEELDSKADGHSVTVESSSFSPFLLAAANESEPDSWLFGQGYGTRSNKTAQFTVKLRDRHGIQYSDHGLGSFMTYFYGADFYYEEDGRTKKKGVNGTSVCGDPRKEGGHAASDEVSILYEYTTPMLLKAMYYGGGPGYETMQEITGTSNKDYNNIILHIAVSQIYATMAMPSKGGKAGWGSTRSALNDAYEGANQTARNLAIRFAKAIAGKSIPGAYDGYRVYVAHYDDDSVQDFVFADFPPITPPQTGRLTVEKYSNQQSVTDNMTAFKVYYSLKGAKFQVLDSKNKLVATLTTDQNGEADVELPPGTYTVTEVKSPLSYEVNSQGKSVRVEAGKDSAPVRFAETPVKTGIRIHKTGRPDLPLKGAEYYLYTDAECKNRVTRSQFATSATKPSADSFVTDDSGSAVITNLPLGKYWVKEEKAPAGYKLDPKIYPVDATDPGENEHVVNSAEESFYGGLRVTKTSANTSVTNANACYSLSGAAFTVYTDAACKNPAVLYSDTKLTRRLGSSVIRTDDKGVTPTAYVALGTYYVRESAAPKGYMLSTGTYGPYTFTAANSGTTAKIEESRVSDQPLTDPVDLIVDKKNSTAGEGDRINSLAGAQFTISYYDGYYTAANLPAAPSRKWVVETKYDDLYKAYRAALKTDIVPALSDALYTDGAGKPCLPLGTVTIRETKEPAGYRNDADFGGGADTFIMQIAADPAKPDGPPTRIFVRGETNEVTNTGITTTAGEPPYVPTVGTTAKDKDSGIRVSMAGGEVTIEDTVSYTDLIAGETYVMKGRLVDKATGETVKDADGRDVLSETEFTASDKVENGHYTGTTLVTFKFKADASFRNRTVVCYEYVYYQGGQLVVTDKDGEEVEVRHEELSDEGQTIHFPRIRTSVLDEASGTRNVLAQGIQTIIDTVSYENLVPGVEYEVKGILTDKKTGAPVLADGKEITGSRKFTPDAAEGTVDVEFTFDATGMNGKQLVSFEELHVAANDRLVGEHKDLDDLAQTAPLPDVKTDTTDMNTGEKNTLAYDSDEYRMQTVVDKVSFENLIAGQEYRITGELKLIPEDVEGVGFDDAETVLSTVTGAESAFGKVVFDDEGVTFIPEGKEEECVSGSVLIRFTFDASVLEGRTIVVGETVETNGKAVDIHRDIKDDRQYEYFPKGRTAAIDTKTGIKNVLSEERSIIVDTFRYENLIPGKTYCVTGEVMKKVVSREAVEKNTGKDAEEGTGVETEESAGEGIRTTGERVESVMVDRNGDPVKNGYFELIPKEADGEIDLYFLVNTTELQNEDLVLFETVTLNGYPVIIHNYIDDEAQTTYVPEGHTTAVDSETQEQLSLADKEVTILDRFEYKNLIPGTVYTITGRIMKKSDGREIPAQITGAEFAAEGPEEGTEPAGGTEPGEGAESAGGTEPEEGTEPADGTKPGEGAEHAQAGESEGKKKSISFTKKVITFTPDREDGFIDLRFTFDGSALEDEDVVVFERAFHNNAPVIIHENINDVAQTIHVGGGRTFAHDPETGSRTLMAQETVTIQDDLHYQNLLPGKEYTVTGKVMLKPQGNEEATELQAQMVDKDGNPVEKHTFTAAAKDGVETLCFVISAGALAGRSTVVFERVQYNGIDVIVHEDIHDEDETIHFPDGGTRAADSETADHIANADEEVTILDEVQYQNLIPSKSYTVTGRLMDKETGEPVRAGGKEVTAETSFMPEEADGSVIVPFTFDGSALAGKTTVAFETVSSEGKEVFVHADLTNDDQTVSLPFVETNATDAADGDRTLAASGTVTVVDEVLYRNLIPGKKYVITGVLMSRKTGRPAQAGGRDITGRITFTPPDRNGRETVPFTFAVTDLEAGEYVAFEELYELTADGQVLVGSHKDLADAAQTVTRPANPAKPGRPGNPRTGDRNSLSVWIWMAAGAAALAGIIAVIIKKRKEG